MNHFHGLDWLLFYFLLAPVTIAPRRDNIVFLKPVSSLHEFSRKELQIEMRREAARIGRKFGHNSADNVAKTDYNNMTFLGSITILSYVQSI